MPKEQTLQDLIDDARQATRELREATKDYHLAVKAYKDCKAELPDAIRKMFEREVVTLVVPELEKIAPKVREAKDTVVATFQAEITRLGKLFLDGEDGTKPLEKLIRARRMEFEMGMDEVIDRYVTDRQAPGGPV